ncbi:MAG: hypothetical protein JW997_07320, partial [Actinobacteria bacterium]|nr:hypothetical protein [Actinomycetota bacterium]
MQSRNKLVFLFAVIIIIFGIIGLIPCAACFYYTGKINITNPGSNYVITSLGSSVQSVNVLLDTSSEALTDVAGTVEEARDSLKDASKMLESSSEALAEVSEIIEFEILGMKPLAGLSEYFGTMSEDAGKLSGSIFNMADSIGTNIDDIKKIAADVSNISVNLSSFSTSFERTAAALPDFNIKIILYAVFAYLGVLNIVFIIIGLSLFSLGRQALHNSA